MSIFIEDNVINMSSIDKNIDIIDFYYSIIHENDLVYSVYYLKLNNVDIYDSYITRYDITNVFRTSDIEEQGIILFNNFYYRINQVHIKETLNKNIGDICCVTTYEIMNIGKIGKYKISDEIVNFFGENDCIYNIYVNNDIIMNPWVFYKVIDEKYVKYLEMIPFMRSFENNMPYFSLDYEYSIIKESKDICVRFIIFMDDITLNSDKISCNDIRENKVYIGNKDNCIFFGY